MVWCGNLFLRGNRVSKAWFIYQQNLKKFEVSTSHTSQNTQKKNPEHNHQIWGRKNLDYEGERTLLNGSILRRRLGWKKPKPRVAWVACATWAASDGLGSSLFVSVFFFFLLWVLLWYVLGFSLIFIRVGNWALETRFPCGCHVKKYVTLDHIRLWKSSLLDSRR